ncbi:MAG: serine protease Do [Nitrospirota bacterium]|nr:serine protease Do [Nitrospirota bacterium]
MMRGYRSLTATVALCSILSPWANPVATAALTDSAGIRMLEEIQTVITELAEQAKPSVVNLFPIVGA